MSRSPRTPRVTQIFLRAEASRAIFPTFWITPSAIATVITLAQTNCLCTAQIPFKFENTTSERLCRLFQRRSIVPSVSPLTFLNLIFVFSTLVAGSILQTTNFTSVLSGFLVRLVGFLAWTCLIFISRSLSATLAPSFLSETVLFVPPALS